MIVFSTIIFILIIVSLTLSLALIVSTIVLGGIIIISGNVISKIKRGKCASVLWNILAIATTIGSTALLWDDVFSESANYGAAPFLILFLFALFSLTIFGVIITKKGNNATTSPARANKKTPKKLKVKVRRINRP